MTEIKVGQTVLIKYRNAKGVVIDKRKGSIYSKNIRGLPRLIFQNKDVYIGPMNLIL